VHTSPAHVAVVLLNVVLQYESPPVPGQHPNEVVDPAAGFAMHAWPEQHMSLVGLGVQVPGSPPVAPGVPVHAAATHRPIIVPVVSQTLPLVHCESDVQGPHTFAVVAPQMGADEVHWAFVQQLPGTHAVPPPDAQQKSAVLAHVVSIVQPVPVTHVPPFAGLQIVVGP
jgi:hypothetical protein